MTENKDGKSDKQNKASEMGGLSTKGRIHFVSLGCAKNLVDTEVLMGLAEAKGWVIEPEAEAAEMIVVNTCAFIGPAKEESIETILELAAYKQSGALTKLVMAGCLSQRYADELAKEMPEVDMFIGTGDQAAFDSLLAGSEDKRISVSRPEFLLDAKTPRLRATPFYAANVKLSEGCSNVCAFCIIPRLRGPQRSRSMGDILAEVRGLLDSGVRELCLIGQNTSAYGEDLPECPSITNLLRVPELAQGDHWVRLHYLYPGGVKDELIEAIREAPAVLPYFDIPVQHIDSDILAAMRRHDDEASTRSAIERVRSRIPEAVIRTSVMVGFPGESEAQFKRLLDFVAEGHFDHLGAFTYSQEEGTVAAKLDGQLEEAVKQERLERLMGIQKEVSARRLKAFKGRVLDVLVCGASEEHELLLTGRTYGQAAEIDGVTYLVDGHGEVGDIVEVEITRTHDYEMEGRILNPGQEVDSE